MGRKRSAHPPKESKRNGFSPLRNHVIHNMKMEQMPCLNRISPGTCFFKKILPPMPRAQDVQLLPSPPHNPQHTPSSPAVVERSETQLPQAPTSHKTERLINALKHSNIITKSNCLLASGIELLFLFLLFFNSLRTIKRVDWQVGLISSNDNEEEL